MRGNFINMILAGSLLLFLPACNDGNKAEEGQAPDGRDQLNPTEKITVANQQVLTFADPHPMVREQVNKLLQAYLRLKENLVESSAEGAKEVAAELPVLIQNFNSQNLPEEQKAFYTERSNAIKKSAGFVAQTKQLEEQRTQFSALTKNIYELCQAFRANEEKLYYQYCPMAFNNNGGFWLSEAKEIRNPYYGVKMLKCGRVAEIIERN